MYWMVMEWIRKCAWMEQTFLFLLQIFFMKLYEIVLNGIEWIEKEWNNVELLNG